MYARVENFDLQFEQRPMFLRKTELSRGAKDVYSFLYLQFKNNITKVGEDNIGQFINVARTIIAENLDMSVKTVIKYLKELVACDFIEDRRMGLNLVNRIYFKEHPAMVKTNSNEEVKDEQAQLFEDARAIIGKLTTKVLRNGQINQLLALCNNDLEELDKAVTYNLGKDIRNVVACIADTLRNKYYDVKEEEETAGTGVSNKPNYNYPKQPKRSKFHTMMSRDWDFDKIEQAESLHVELKLGNITQEEYNEKIKEIGLF